MADNVRLEIDLATGEVTVFNDIETEARKAGTEAGEQFGKGFNKEQKKTKRGLSKFFSGLASSAKKAGVAFAAATIAAGALGSSLLTIQSIQAAQVQEDAVSDLNAALKLAGEFSTAASQDIQDFASSLQQLTTVGDETIISMFNLARTFTDTNEQAKSLIDAALDLSAATGRALEFSILNLGKSLSGLAGELGESVKGIRSLTVAQLKAGGAIDLVSKRFNDAAKNINTFSRASKQAGNNLGDTVEELGFFVTKSSSALALIKGFSQVFIGLSKSLKSLRGNNDILQPLILSSLRLGKSLINFVVKPLEVTLGILNVFRKAIQEAIPATIVFLDKAAGILSDKLSELLALVGVKGVSIGETLSSTFAAIGDDMGLVFGDSISTGLSDGLTDSLTLLEEFVNKAAPITDTFKNNTVTDFKNTAKAALLTAEGLAQAVEKVLVDSLSAAALEIGKSLRTGGDAFKAFSGQILSIIGDLAINLGKTLIAVGIGIESVRNSLATLSGGAAIAAGFALVALGGFLKSFGGAGLGAVSSSGGGGGGNTGIGAAGLSDDTTSDPDSLEKAEASTSLVVNVEGFATGTSEDLGLFVAEALNDAASKNNVILTDVRTA